jgi:hypothetical protein
MPTVADDTLLRFSLPSICQKKVTAAFDGGRISSDGGVVLLAGAERRLGLIDTLAALMPDHRDPALTTHSMSDILRARVFAIACGYPDADHLDDLRRDPAFKLACGRLPESGDDLHSQPTMSRWENAPRPAHADPNGTRHGGPVVPEPSPPTEGRHPRYRRHRRHGARPSAAVAVQRSLRRTLLSADPHL